MSPGHRRQHGRRAGTGPAAGRSGGVDRHLGHRVRGHHVPAADPSGAVAGFADATGRFLPLVCTVNAGLVLSAVARPDRHRPGRAVGGRARRRARCGRDHPAALPRRRADTQPAARQRGAARPDHPQRHPAEPGPGRAWKRCSPPWPTRPACSPLHGVEQRRVLLIGGGARSEAVRAAGAGDLRRPGHGARARGVRGARRRPAGGVGAGRDAGAARTGPAGRPREYTGPPVPDLRERFAELRDATATWAERTEEPVNAADRYAAGPQRPVLVRHLDRRVAGSGCLRAGGAAAHARRPGRPQARRARRLRGQLPRQRRVRLRREPGRAGPADRATSGRRWPRPAWW